MNDAVIRLVGVTKYYGRQPGVSDLDLDLELQRGEVFGYLGPTGKTTTIHRLPDLIRPTLGLASVSSGPDP